MTTCYNSLFVVKISNKEFAKKIYDIRQAYDSEIERLVDYRANGIISSQRLMEHTTRTIEHFDAIFIKEFEELPIEEKIQLISEWKEFANFAELGLFKDSDVLLAAARIIK